MKKQKTPKIQIMNGKPVIKVKSNVYQELPMQSVVAKRAARAKTEVKTPSFNEAFASARKSNKDIFTWKGKKYHTKTKEDVQKERKANLDSITKNAPKAKPLSKTLSKTKKVSKPSISKGVSVKSATPTAKQARKMGRTVRKQARQMGRTVRKQARTQARSIRKSSK